MSLARPNCLRLAYRLKPPCAALPRAIGPIQAYHQQHQFRSSQLSLIRSLDPASKAGENARKKAEEKAAQQKAPPVHIPKRPVKSYSLMIPEKDMKRRRAKERAAAEHEQEKERRKEKNELWYATLSPHVRAMYEKMKWTGVEDKDGTKSFELPGQKSPNRDQRRRLKLIERQYHEIRARLKIPEGAKENEKEDEVLEELRSWTNALDEKTVLRTSRMAEKLAEKARSAMKTREMAGKRMSSELGLEPYKPRRRDIRELLAMEHKAKRLTKKARTLLSKLPGDVARNYERDLNEAEKGMRLAVELADKARELSDKAQEQVSDKSE